MQQFENAREAALALRPDDPVYCFRPEVLKADARQFMEMFPGKTAYAVKTNGEPMVLKALVEAGVTAFDVASPGEFAAVRAVSPDAEMLYMHPVKAQSDIRLALEKYGIRVIAIDHEDEITKLTRVVRALDIDPGAITVFVRIQTKGQAAYELSKKFGAGPAYAVELAQRLDRTGFKVGLCFHVGSQIEDPDTYERALASADWVRNRIGFDARRARRRRRLSGRIRPRPQPQAGRDAVARPAHVAAVGRPQGMAVRPRCRWSPSPAGSSSRAAFSLIVRVLLRKGKRLYINDGIWASLSDSWIGKITLPARFIPDPAIRPRNGQREEHRAVQGVRRDLRFRRHPVAAVLAAGDGRHRRLDRDRPYRRLFAVAAGPASTASIPTPSSR